MLVYKNVRTYYFVKFKHLNIFPKIGFLLLAARVREIWRVSARVWMRKLVKLGHVDVVEQERHEGLGQLKIELHLSG